MSEENRVIIKSEVEPFYDKDSKMVRWAKKDNWAVEIPDEHGTKRRYYGLRTKKDAER